MDRDRLFPALDQAVRWSGPLALSVGLAGLVAVVAAGAAWGERATELGPFLALVAGVSLLTAAAVVPLWLITRARARLAAARRAPVESQALLGDAALAVTAGTEDATGKLLRLAHWPQAVISLPLAAAAVAVVAIIRPSPLAGDDAGQLVIGVAAVILAFPLLIWERRLQGVSAADLPEAAALGRILRLVVWVLVAGGLAAVARSFDLEQAAWIQAALGVLIGLAACEAGLRALACPFLPTGRIDEAKALGDGALLGLLCTRGGAGGGFGTGLKERFGLDISRSWAVRFLKQTGPALLGVLAVVAWLLTGLTALGSNERGLYERFGAPSAVFGPGLHAHLPWPFGLVRRTELGRIHELPIILEDTPPIPDNGVEADPDAAWDRLWERAHATDVTYLAPTGGASGGHQLINADIRVMWRIGLTDADAQAVMYTISDAPTLIRAHANQLVLGDLATTSISGLISADRDALAQRLRERLAARLAGTGLEISAVVVDAIHPPTKAVPAFHGVQAAEIGAATDVAVARAKAAAQRADAAREATGRRDQGDALAAEATTTARADAIRFTADEQAFTTAPQAMTLERRLQTLGKALNRAQITIVDHRLTIEGGTTLDLRRSPGPGTE